MKKDLKSMTRLIHVFYSLSAIVVSALFLTCNTIEFEEGAKPVLTLLGPDPYLLNIGDNYTEPAGELETDSERVLLRIDSKFRSLADVVSKRTSRK